MALKSVGQSAGTLDDGWFSGSDLLITSVGGNFASYEEAADAVVELVAKNRDTDAVAEKENGRIQVYGVRKAGVEAPHQMNKTNSLRQLPSVVVLMARGNGDGVTVG